MLALIELASRQQLGPAAGIEGTMCGKTDNDEKEGEGALIM